MLEISCTAARSDADAGEGFFLRENHASSSVRTSRFFWVIHCPFAARKTVEPLAAMRDPKEDTAMSSPKPPSQSAPCSLRELDTLIVRFAGVWRRPLASCRKRGDFPSALPTIWANGGNHASRRNAKLAHPARLFC